MASNIKKIYINSKDRINGNACDFTVQIGNHHTIKHCIGAQLSNAIIPISFYNIDESNNKFYWGTRWYGSVDVPYSNYFNDSTDKFIAIIPPGNYTITALHAQLKIQMDTILNTAYTPDIGTVELTYNDITSHSTITGNGAIINGLSESGQYSYLNVYSKTLINRYYPTINYKKSINFVLGFCDDDNISLESQRPTLNASGFLNTQYINAADGTIHFTSLTLHKVYGKTQMYVLTDITNGALTTSQNNSLNSALAQIPITSYYSELQFSSASHHNDITNCISNSFSQINIRLVDENNEVFNLQGGEWSCTISLFYDNMPE
jgi:hypothetical protein